MNKFRMRSVFVVLAMLFGFANALSASAAVTFAVTLQESTATISQPGSGLFVYEAVDGILVGQVGNELNGWATWTGSSTAQTAVWETSSDVNASQLDFTLYHTWDHSHSLGRFRLSYTTDDRSTFADGLTENGDVTANWTVLTGATVSSSCACGDTFTILGDDSILVGGTNPATNIYYVSFASNFSGVTGIRLEAIPDASLPQGGAGRGGNGNWHLIEITLDATMPSPLDDGGWELVAHMSNIGGMFDGNGELMPNYSYGTFVANPVASTPDFQRVFPVAAEKILFITGDGSIWGIADYGDLRALIDARGGVFVPNLPFKMSVNGTISNPIGNVLSRPNFEDPWISIDGEHFAGINNQRIVWGENNYVAGTHQALKNNHGGINVYIMSGNEPPTTNAGGPHGGNEGSAIAMSGATATDPDLDALTYAWTVDSNLCSFDDASALNPNLTCSDNGSYTATLSVDDGVNPAVSSDASVTVGNVAPTVGTVSVPTAPIDINNQPVTGVSAPFTDPGTADIHTCTVDYGDGSGPKAGTVAGTTCTGPNQTYAESGVYAVTVTVTDKDNDSGSATATEFIVIYDPSGGFVTGGGWIDSPAGAYTPDDLTVFEANFDSGTPTEFSGSTTTEGVQGYAGLGTDSNVFGGNFLRNSSLPDARTTLTLTGLPPHNSISLGFLLATIDSWDGDVCHAGPDSFNVTVDGTPIFSEVFENSNCGLQTYAPPAGVQLARRAALGFNSPAPPYGDSAYNMGLDPSFQNIPHTSSTLTVEWFASGFWQGGDDESWAIDNVVVLVADEDVTGKANFGFVSKYKKGASVPTGNTEFQFKAGDLNFHSDTYQWLVVNQAGANAQYKGSGTINGDLAPNGELYQFMLWGGDGTGTNGEDTFRIKIWYEEGDMEVVIYDNGFDQAIGGGNIKIHKGN